VSYRTRLRTIMNRATLPCFVLLNTRKERFTCPVCGYGGPFRDVNAPSGLRRHAQCPKCSALERHRLQYVVLEHLLAELQPETWKMLHFAPEAFFRRFFSTRFGTYETADLEAHDVDHNVDMRRLPFPDESYDFVFASHVLEHIQDDDRAISEVRRILNPNGIAILPVPIVADHTVEYPEANAAEFGHVRAPGLDYFERYARYFTKVEKITSDSLPFKYQLFVYEDRSQWPTNTCPLRPSMKGERHIDVVPICYV
jgi:SAM-dependent methyltransferase